ncbi:MAG: shikimate kinase / 3-dehydroquinate synthase [Solirubrobacterales bacterium]|nr:shikimate kinase / 3-dehydroquinate synthase [Solirubrobacterales bacterium]
MAEVSTKEPPAQPAIVFIGFMAAGKSEAARAAAGRLGEDVRDADELLEAELGMPIAEFFEREGEEEFRRREEELVLGLLEGGGVIALGGGAVMSEPVRDALGGQVTVWCQVEEDVAWNRAQTQGGRPLASIRGEFAQRFAERQPIYADLARAVLPEGGTVAGAATAPWLDAMRSEPAVRMIWARAASGAYPAAVGEGAARMLAAAEPDRRLFVIADAAVLAEHEGLLPPADAVLEIEASEERKTLGEAERLLRELAAAGARRDDLIVALGGGVTGDLAGFVAATYQRGVPVVQIPTTVVAQVDSAYGGKTGVDLPEAKNYVGAYHQPLAVLADPSVLATLPAEEVAAGFAEVLKTALIAGGDLWESVREIDFAALVAGGGDELGDLVFACARAKIDVVGSDERDAGRRAVLNLGHTVGHAIEAATGYGRYRHGEAVGLGLLAALRLSGAGDLRDEVAELLATNGLPTSLDGGVGVDEVLDATALDKKHTSAGLGFVLLERPGEPRWGQEVEPSNVRDAVDELYEDA